MFVTLARCTWSSPYVGIYSTVIWIHICEMAHLNRSRMCVSYSLSAIRSISVWVCVGIYFMPEQTRKKHTFGFYSIDVYIFCFCFVYNAPKLFVYTIEEKNEWKKILIYIDNRAKERSLYGWMQLFCMIWCAFTCKEMHFYIESHLRWMVKHGEVNECIHVKMCLVASIIHSHSVCYAHALALNTQCILCTYVNPCVFEFHVVCVQKCHRTFSFSLRALHVSHLKFVCVCVEMTATLRLGFISSIWYLS